MLILAAACGTANAMEKTKTDNVKDYEDIKIEKMRIKSKQT